LKSRQQQQPWQLGSQQVQTPPPEMQQSSKGPAPTLKTVKFTVFKDGLHFLPTSPGAAHSDYESDSNGSSGAGEPPDGSDASDADGGGEQQPAGRAFARAAGPLEILTCFDDWAYYPLVDLSADKRSTGVHHYLAPALPAAAAVAGGLPHRPADVVRRGCTADTA